MTYITIKKQKVNLGTTSFPCRSIKNLVESELDELLQSLDWSEFYNSTDSNECWKIMYLNFLEVLDTLCQEKTYKDVKKTNEWVTSQLFEVMLRRDHLVLFKEAKSKKIMISGSEQNNLETLLMKPANMQKRTSLNKHWTENKGIHINSGKGSGHYMILKVQKAMLLLN